MIPVDLYVPMLNENYDFEWDGDLPAGGIVRQVLEVLTDEEEIFFPQKEYYLYACELGIVLDPGRSLKDQGVQAGEPFVLI